MTTQFGQICCGCNEGGTVPHYDNVTTGYVFDSNPADIQTGPGLLSRDATLYNPWFTKNPIYYFVASQEFTTLFPPSDIPPGTNDATHFTVNGNFYHTNGTVNISSTQRFGGKWITAQKQWHGKFGIIDADDPNIVMSATLAAQTNVQINPAQNTTFLKSAPQRKFRTVICSAATSGTDGPGSAQCTSTVGQYTGVITNTGASTTGAAASDFVFGFLVNLTNQAAFNYFAAWMSTVPSGYNSQILDASGIGNGPWTLQVQETNLGGGTVYCNLESLSVTQGGMSRTAWSILQSPVTGNWASYQTFQESLSYGNEQASYLSNRTILYLDGLTGAVVVVSTAQRSGSIKYQDPYTSADVMQDIYNLLRVWPLGDETYYPWRTDESLALSPVICYDEVNAPIPPNCTTSTSDDYRLPQVGAAWQQMPWLDPNSYIWIYQTSAQQLAGQCAVAQPGGFTGGSPGAGVGAALFPASYLGGIWFRNAPGSDPHFWFAATIYNYNTGTLHWDTYKYGQETPAYLPKCAMRWTNARDSQASASTPGINPPQYPQAFISEGGGTVVAAKYVVATQPWPAVNNLWCYNQRTVQGNTGQWTVTMNCSPGSYSIATSPNAAGTALPPPSAASARTGVFAEWSFNQRGYQSGWQALYGVPAWYGSIHGCTGIYVQQFNYNPGSCRAVVGVVPFYSQSPTGAQTPTGGALPPSAVPMEGFSNFVPFAMPDNFQFDSQFGALWLSEVYLTMPDPLCVLAALPGGCSWTQDNGCGYGGSGISTDPYHYLSNGAGACALVEAASQPASPYGTNYWPSGVHSPLDPNYNVLAPPQYPGLPNIGGIPQPTDGTQWTQIATDWGFTQYVYKTPGSWAYGFYANFVNLTPGAVIGAGVLAC